jgi:hypothetical protein
MSFQEEGQEGEKAKVRPDQELAEAQSRVPGKVRSTSHPEVPVHGA